MDSNIEEQPIVEPKRIRAFAQFFKNYMSISSLIVASLPIPITSLKLIPVFNQQINLFSVYTTMFCFLLLGYVFYMRHALTPLLFPTRYGQIFISPVGGFWRLTQLIKGAFIGSLPAVLIVCAIFFVFKYQEVLATTIATVKDRVIDGKNYHDYRYGAKFFNAPLVKPDSSKDVRYYDSDFILNNYQIINDPINTTLMLYYFGIFIFAESAFILMAIKEYLQDVLGFSEKDLIDTGSFRLSRRR